MRYLGWSWRLSINLALPTTLMVGSANASEKTPVAHPRVVALQGGDSAMVLDFVNRVKVYVALHQKLEATLPHLPKQATPEQIKEREDALASLIRTDRATAKQGDLFTPAMAAYLKGVLKRVFSRPDGKKLRASIMDEYPGNIALRVNGKYPDAVPIASMPPEVLAALPKLPEEIEYRFVGDQFILFDPHAHIIPDFVPNVLPAV